jgi:hypothetical protein
MMCISLPLAMTAFHPMRSFVGDPTNDWHRP